jgi:L-ascorbate metabolism protein UlaG (beta-lactamase superfamily)
MDITWHGYSCFTIKTKQATIVIDPYDPAVTGIKLPQLKADIVLISHNHSGHNYVAGVGGEPKVLDWPGEYEVKGIAIVANKVPYSKEGNKEKKGEGMFFTIAADDLRLCFMGDMGEVDDALIEGIGDVDILMLPIGGRNTMDAKQAHDVIEEIEPRAVIPMHYAIKGAKGELDEMEPFLKLVGAGAIEPKEKFTVGSRSELKEDKMECVVLTPQTA